MRYIALLGAVALAIVGWSGVWFYAAGEVVTSIENWSEQRRAMGMTVAYDELSVSGYPFRVRVDAPGVEIGMPAHPLKPLFRSNALKAIGQPWDLKHILLELNGAHSLSFGPAKTRNTFRFVTETGLASVKLDGAGRINRVSIDFGNASFAMKDTILADTERLRVHLRPGQRSETLFDLAVQLGRSRFVSPRPMPLGNEISALDLQVSLQGGIDGLPAGAHPVVYWRDQGGALDVTKMHLAWGPVITDTNGTLSLDQEMRPLGAMTARITGHNVLVDIARAEGQLSEDGASAAKVALGLLAAANGGRLSVPLNMQDGHVFLGPVKFARLMPLLKIR